MPASIIVPLFVFLPFMLGLFWLAANVRWVEKKSSGLEERFERLGEKVGEAAIGVVWKLMKIDDKAVQERNGSYYADMTSGRHEALSALDTHVENDRRILFLHEVEFATRMNFASVENHTVKVSPKQRKRIAEFILLSPLYGDDAVKVFMQHGYVLEGA